MFYTSLKKYRNKTWWKGWSPVHSFIQYTDGNVSSYSNALIWWSDLAKIILFTLLNISHNTEPVALCWRFGLFRVTALSLAVTICLIDICPAPVNELQYFPNRLQRQSSQYSTVFHSQHALCITTTCSVTSRRVFNLWSLCSICFHHMGTVTLSFSGLNTGKLMGR